MSRLEDHVDSLPSWKKTFYGKYRTDLVTRISEILEEKGWSQSDLADALGCTDANVSKLLSGSANITLKTVSKLEAALEEDVMHIAWSPNSDHESDMLPKHWASPIDDKNLESHVEAHEWNSHGEEKSVKILPGEKGWSATTVSMGQLDKMQIGREVSLS